MHNKILCAGVTLCFACAPSLSDGQGARCSETLACDDGFSCYRGFCLPEEERSAPSAEPAPIAHEDRDAGQPAGDELVARPDAGGAPASPLDAAAAPASAADAAVTGAAAPLDDAGADPKLAAKPKPTVPAPTAPAPQGAPPNPGAPDAAAPAPADAALQVPDAVALSGKCTLKECCEEALRAADDDDDEREEHKGGKDCGCDDAQLISSLLCDLL